MSPLSARIAMALQNPAMGGGLQIPNAGLFGGPATLPSGAGPVDPPILTGDPSGAGSVSPHLFPGGGDDHWTPNAEGGVTVQDFGWTQGTLPGGPITGYGYNDPRGINPPTAVPTFWGPSNGAPNVATGVPGGGGNFGVPGGLLPNRVAGHNANYWVF
jgi:hypothetical protein